MTTESGGSLLRQTTRRPDPARVAQCERAPERGPKLLFFSGGSAIAKMSRRLKRLTHNSVHLVTAFDSGGSSAAIRNAFGVLSVGDLRQRVLSLADETARGNPEIYRLFSHRLPAGAAADALRAELEQLAAGDHALIRRVPTPLRELVRTHLREFFARMPADFDLRRASIGNLVITGGMLANRGDIDAVLALFSRAVEARGLVRPIVASDVHLAATLASGERIVGQHRITGKECAPIGSPIVELTLVDSLAAARPIRVDADSKICELIRTADLICYPPGSFYSSVMANLLIGGVGRAIAEARCPKIYVPNMGVDPEQLGMTLDDAVGALIDAVRRDAGARTRVDQILNFVAVDREKGRYENPVDSGVERRGIEIVDMPLVKPTGWPWIDAAALAECLVSLTG